MRRESSYPMSLKALMLMALCVMTTHTAQAVVVNFPDPGLEAAVRDAINKPTGDILDTDLVGTGFTKLSANKRGITDLKGLERCTDLTTLGLGGNQISDISPLAGLTNLRVLHLSTNQISEIGPLAGLINLMNLYLDKNEVSDLSPLAGLTNLQWLYLYTNRVSDLSPLAALTNLTKSMTSVR